MSITNTFPDVLEEFRFYWGGKIRKKKTQEHHRDAYEWEVSGRDASECAKDLLPYLREKHLQAALVANLMDIPKTCQQREASVALLKSLKRIQYGTRTS